MRASKKVGLTLVAVALIAVTATIGGTYAWFVDSAAVENEATFGNVEIEITEAIPEGAVNRDVAATEGAQTTTVGLEFKNVVPGDVIAKNPTITNTGKNSAYVRAQVNIAVTRKNGQTTTGSALSYGMEGKEDITKVFDSLEGISSDWNLIDGYYYYNRPLQAGEDQENVTLFTNVNFARERFGNTWQGAEITIEVIGQAIQSDYVEPITEKDIDGNVIKITSWNVGEVDMTTGLAK